MYNKILVVFFSIALIGNIQSQNKQDYYWPFAKDRSLEPGLQAFEFNFNKRPFIPSEREGGLGIDQMNASICDKDGNLLFYTNGCAVANRLHQIMPNGDSLNAGTFFDDFWGGDCAKGYPGTQDITILPDPGYDKGYYIIHKPTSYNPMGSPSKFSLDSILYSYVDLTLDGGYGDITEKNVNLFRGPLVANYLTPITHTNGNDYWIVNPIHPEGYIVFELSEKGIEFNKIESGPVWDERKSNSAGHARISPDGTQYAYFNQYDGLYLYDFDRSDATLSEEQHIPWRRPEEGIFATCEWSPDSRFLYLAKWDTLWQLDTYAEPLADGLEFIEAKEIGATPPAPHFGIAALGPDCRIYIRDKSSARSMHVIHKPNEKGQACDFVQQSLQLPYVSSVGSFPNFPRFRVDEEEKCDPSIVSAFGETIYWRRDLTVYPSPASEYITIEIPDAKQGHVFIINMEGQIVQQQAEVYTKTSLAISELPAGMYSVEFVPDNKKERLVYTKKIIVE